VDIQAAELSDVPWLVRTMCAAMYELHGSEELYNEQYLTESLAPLVISEGVCLLAKLEGKAVGCIAGLVSTLPYNPEITIMVEMVWWVREDQRGSSAGLRLLKAFEAEAWARGAQKIAMSTMPSTHLGPEAMAKRGHVLKEFGYMKNRPAEA